MSLVVIHYCAWYLFSRIRHYYAMHNIALYSVHILIRACTDAQIVLHQISSKVNEEVLENAAKIMKRIFPLCQCLKSWFGSSVLLLMLLYTILILLKENIKNLEKWQSSIRVEWQNIEQLLNDFQTTQKRSNILEI